MTPRHRLSPYLATWAFALAFGWIEAAVVVYLRAVILGAGALQSTSELRIALVTLPDSLVWIEVVREGCTMLLLAATAWLAGRRLADRFGAFLIAFGVWDLAFYAFLKVMIGWPDSLGTWDVLFLIPRPWLAPVWAPCLIAAFFVASGSYLFWTPDRPRRYGWLDAGVLIAANVIIIGAFLVESNALVEHRNPEQFAVWIYALGLALGVGWFVHVERQWRPSSVNP